MPPFPHLERPERVEQVLAGFARVRETAVHIVEDTALEAVRALHDADYVNFLLTLDAALAEGETYIPTVFRDDPRRAPVRMRGGAYCREIGTPVMPGTVDTALNAAATARAAAAALVGGGADVVAALCRPPGHHAGRRRYGGYCYFNNAYLAAGVLAEAGRCAVLDVDYHLGDGSMEFAGTAVPYYSLHADPWRSYPYLSEVAVTDRPGLHLYNIPEGADGTVYATLLGRVCEAVRAGAPDYLVLSLGFDTLGSDYIQDQEVALTAADFGNIGAQVAGIGARTLLLLEGGYDAAGLADCAAAFLAGYHGEFSRD